MITIKATVIRRSVRSQAGNIVGTPLGGNAGQVLKKRSTKDHDTYWADDEGGAAGSQPTPVTVSSASTTWHVLHNKGYKPLVAVFNSFGEELIVDVEHVSSNEFYVYFAAPTTGSLTHY